MSWPTPSRRGLPVAVFVRYGSHFDYAWINLTTQPVAGVVVEWITQESAPDRPLQMELFT